MGIEVLSTTGIPRSRSDTPNQSSGKNQVSNNAEQAAPTSGGLCFHDDLCIRMEAELRFMHGTYPIL